MMALPSPLMLLAAGRAAGCSPTQRPWLGRQSWQHMVLAHWRVPAAKIQALLPHSISVDTREGTAWVSVVAYRMAHVRLRGMPNAMGLRFPQLNLRTYVRVNGRPGIFFFSLDAASRLAVRTGAWITGLPYHRAAMRLDEGPSQTQFTSQRCGAGPAFAVHYAPLATPYVATPLDRWLTDRYVFFSPRGDGRVLVGDVCHGAWPLQKAEATITENTLGMPFGLPLEDAPAHLQYSRGVDVLFWRPLPLEDPARGRL